MSENYTVFVEGDGAFGQFLNVLIPTTGLVLATCAQDASTIILAVPEEAYAEVALKYRTHHLVNVCSVQMHTMRDCLKATRNVTGIHPLFGSRTPLDKRFGLITHISGCPGENAFLPKFAALFARLTHLSPEDHDQLMLKVHAKAVEAAQKVKSIVEEAAEIPDYMIPNSFRLLRTFVGTLDDMPAGTLQSIQANPFLKDI
jgi:prephenate dehydrogenase